MTLTLDTMLVGHLDGDRLLDLDERPRGREREAKKPQEFLPESWRLDAGKALWTELGVLLYRIVAVGTVHRCSIQRFAFLTGL